MSGLFGNGKVEHEIVEYFDREGGLDAVQRRGEETTADELGAKGWTASTLAVLQVALMHAILVHNDKVDWLRTLDRVWTLRTSMT